MVVVANKADLEHERQVGTHEGQALAKHFGCRFIETSAKQRMNVDEAFHDLVREIRRYNKVCRVCLLPLFLSKLGHTDPVICFGAHRSKLRFDLELPPRASRPSSKKSRPSLQDAAPAVSSSKSPVLLFPSSRPDARPITIFPFFFRLSFPIRGFLPLLYARAGPRFLYPYARLKHSYPTQSV